AVVEAAGSGAIRTRPEAGGPEPAAKGPDADARQQDPAAGQTGAVSRTQPAQTQDQAAGAQPEKTPETATPAPAGSHFAVHVASFRETQRAGRETDYLEKHGYVASIREADVKGVTWYRVLVGEYRTREEANAARVALLALPRIGYAQIVTVKDR
ncbi:MAG: SPOR domain-containing protein, partial [Candidatus Krumholzibacteria bacterium]|nr:SPOR domain-containing protein [Candidatus Krumholzibacteria bacterium]